jgi:hypothetical protein
MMAPSLPRAKARTGPLVLSCGISVCSILQLTIFQNVRSNRDFVRTDDVKGNVQFELSARPSARPLIPDPCVVPGVTPGNPNAPKFPIAPYCTSKHNHNDLPFIVPHSSHPPFVPER